MIAFVEGDKTTNTINVCPAFWKLPVYGGFNTQVGTFVHELSHFKRIAGTIDISYGVSGCQVLATNAPQSLVSTSRGRSIKPVDKGSAIDNADNWQFYAEAVYHNTLKFNGHQFQPATPSTASKSKPKHIKFDKPAQPNSLKTNKCIVKPKSKPRNTTKPPAPSSSRFSSFRDD